MNNMPQIIDLLTDANARLKRYIEGSPSPNADVTAATADVYDSLVMLQNDPPSKPHDMVNHPKHYDLGGGLEVIDIIDAVAEDMSKCGVRGDLIAHTYTVLQYVLRWYKKNGLEDLQKSEWYLKRMIEAAQEPRHG